MRPGPPAVPLSQLLGNLRTAAVRPGSDPLIRGLAYDSRKVQPGDLFVCLRGAKDDGHRHAVAAARDGAAAVLAERSIEGLDGLPLITVADSRRELARLAARFYSEPSARLHLTGVTGTEGKTTTVYLLDAILRGAGRSTGMFGTIVNRIGARTEPAALILDRAEAVRVAVSLARPGDAILLAGKGHEDFQLVGGVRIPYSDHQAANEALGCAARDRRAVTDA